MSEFVNEYVNKRAQQEEQKYGQDRIENIEDDHRHKIVSNIDVCKPVVSPDRLTPVAGDRKWLIDKLYLWVKRPRPKRTYPPYWKKISVAP